MDSITPVRKKMEKKRCEKALLELSLIAMQADIYHNQIGYWEHLHHEQSDSRYKLNRLISTQTDKVAQKLTAWGKRWGILA